MKHLLINQAENIVKFDLVWFFCHSEADCGIQSNWNAMVNAACYSGSSDYHDPYNTFMLNSIHHKRQLEKIFYSLSTKYQKVLFATFADITFSPHIKRIFGEQYVGASYCNSHLSPDKLELLCRKITLGKATNQEKLILSNIRVEASLIYRLSINAYISARNKMGIK